MKKTVDCVELQRKLREQHAKRFPRSKNRELLAHLKKKYGAKGPYGLIDSPEQSA